MHGRAPGREVYTSLSTIRPSPSASSAWPRPQQSTRTPAPRQPRRLRIATAVPRHEEHAVEDIFDKLPLFAVVFLAALIPSEKPVVQLTLALILSIDARRIYFP